MSVGERVLEIVKDYLGSEKVELDSLLVEDLGADELDIVSLSMNIEDEFHLEVTCEEYEAWKIIRDIVDLVKKKEP